MSKMHIGLGNKESKAISEWSAKGWFLSTIEVYTDEHDDAFNESIRLYFWRYENDKIIRKTISVS